MLLKAGCLQRSVGGRCMWRGGSLPRCLRCGSVTSKTARFHVMNLATVPTIHTTQVWRTYVGQELRQEWQCHDWELIVLFH